MATHTSVGIHSIGIYLPEERRPNSFWPKEVVDGWRRKIEEKSATVQVTQPPPDLPPGPKAVMEAIKAEVQDPFRGIRERRVRKPDMVSSDMETLAGRDALQRAGVDPKEVDLLLSFSQLPDFLLVPTAPKVHANLGLSPKSICMGTEGVCNSFQLQVALAEQMIKAGRARYALLTQSSSALHVTRIEDDFSPWFGDAATAVLLGPVSEGRGILGTSFYTDGELYKTLVVGQPGGHWYDRDAKIYTYVEDKRQTMQMLLGVPDGSKQTIHEALKQAGSQPEQVQFYAGHQGTGWMQRVTRQYVGMHSAKIVETWPWTAGLGAANIPMELGLGERDGLLSDGDLVATYAGGSGITWGSLVLRWGK